MGIFLGFIVWLVVAAVVLLIVDRLNLGLKVGTFMNAALAAIVIAVVAAVLGWLLSLLGHHAWRRIPGGYSCPYRRCRRLDVLGTHLQGHVGQRLWWSHHRCHRHRRRRLSRELGVVAVLLVVGPSPRRGPDRRRGNAALWREATSGASRLRFLGTASRRTPAADRRSLSARIQCTRPQALGRPPDLGEGRHPRRTQSAEFY